MEASGHDNTAVGPVVGSHDRWRALEFEIREEPIDGKGVILTVCGELDIETAPELRERLAGAIGRGAESVVVDVAAVDFMDSVSLAVLLSASKSLGGRLATVVAPGSYSRLILDVTGVAQRLGVVETREQALACIQA
jgi:anti-anti-sigma factor